MDKYRKLIIAIMIIDASILIPKAFAAAHQGFPVAVKIWHLFINIAMYAGILLLATSIMNLVMAIKAEDAESKEKAIRNIVVAIGLVTFRVVIDPVLNAIGFYAI